MCYLFISIIIKLYTIYFNHIIFLLFLKYSQMVIKSPQIENKYTQQWMQDQFKWESNIIKIQQV